jgi:hypothetical protein
VVVRPVTTFSCSFPVHYEHFYSMRFHGELHLGGGRFDMFCMSLSR